MAEDREAGGVHGQLWRQAGVELRAARRGGRAGQERAIFLARTCASDTASATQVLVEEFVEGKEYSVEAIAHRGAVALILITEKFKSDLPYFDEVGHIANPAIDPDLEEEIRRFITVLIEAMQFHNGMAHIEIIHNKDGIYLVEIAARPAGCWMPYIHMIGGGFDLVEVVLATLSKAPSLPEINRSRHPVGVFFPFVTDDNRQSGQVAAWRISPPRPANLIVRRKTVYETAAASCQAT